MRFMHFLCACLNHTTEVNSKQNGLSTCLEGIWSPRVKKQNKNNTKKERLPPTASSFSSCPAEVKHLGQAPTAFLRPTTDQVGSESESERKNEEIR